MNIFVQVVAIALAIHVNAEGLSNAHVTRASRQEVQEGVVQNATNGNTAEVSKAITFNKQTILSLTNGTNKSTEQSNTTKAASAGIAEADAQSQSRVSSMNRTKSAGPELRRMTVWNSAAKGKPKPSSLQQQQQQKMHTSMHKTRSEPELRRSSVVGNSSDTKEPEPISLQMKSLKSGSKEETSKDKKKSQQDQTSAPKRSVRSNSEPPSASVTTPRVSNETVANDSSKRDNTTSSMAQQLDKEHEILRTLQSQSPAKHRSHKRKSDSTPRRVIRAPARSSSDGQPLKKSYQTTSMSNSQASSAPSAFNLNKMRLTGSQQFSRQVLFKRGLKGYHSFRIPSLIRTTTGALLAFAEGRRKSSKDNGEIDIVMRSSADNGVTWSPVKNVVRIQGLTVGNPVPVVDHKGTGLITVVFCTNGGKDVESSIRRGNAPPRRVWKTHTQDDGQTWTPLEEITRGLKKPSWTWYAVGPGHGVQLRSGRLVIPAHHAERTVPGKPIQSGLLDFAHLIYSDDSGLSWHLGGSSTAGTGESAVAETSTGGIYLNSRNMLRHMQHHQRGRGKKRLHNRHDAKGRKWSNGTHESSKNKTESMKGGPVMHFDKKLAVPLPTETGDHVLLEEPKFGAGAVLHNNRGKLNNKEHRRVVTKFLPLIPRVRYSSWSSDGSVVRKIRPERTLIEPTKRSVGCQAGLLNVKLEGLPGGNCTLDAIFFSNPSGNQRKKMSIHASTDNGEHWTKLKVVNPGSSAYSDMAVTLNGNLALLYEASVGNINLDIFNLAWLLGVKAEQKGDTAGSSPALLKCPSTDNKSSNL